MDINQLINSAFSNKEGGVIGANKDTFVVEGNPETNHLRVVTGDIYILNTFCFATSEPTGYCFLGMFRTREEAEYSIEYIRTLLRKENGDKLI